MNTLLSLFVLLVATSYLIIWLVFKRVKHREILLQQRVQEKLELLTYAAANERKAIEQLALASSAKRKLISRINHDVRTPLNGVIGMVSLLDNTSLTPEQKEYTDTIRNCSENLLAVINDLFTEDESSHIVTGQDDNHSPRESKPKLDSDSEPSYPVQKLSIEFARQYPLRILVAEDNRVNQRLAMKVLAKLGYDPDISQNGKEVLEEVSKVNYDLILMDVQMPEMDGLEATRMIRLCLPAQPIIIAMTANALEGDREECLQAGMDDYISKPVHLETLVVMLEKWAQHVKERL